MVRPFVLGLIGDSGSGKSSVSKGIATLLDAERVAEVKLDDYQRFTREERKARGLTALNPTVHNLPLFQEHLQLLKARAPVRNRTYNHENGTFGVMRVVEPRDVVLVRGLIGYPTDELRDEFDLAVFLNPEPELLFRWKLRRDVQSRGYTEVEVLSFITRHLLDSKEYVRPQADRADVVIGFALPEWDAPDEAVDTTLTLRRRAMGAETDQILESLPSESRVTRSDDEVSVHLPADLSESVVHEWLAENFPNTHDGERVGRFRDGAGELQFRAPMALIEGVIARMVIADLVDLNAVGS